MKFQISRENVPASGKYVPVEVFEGADSLAAITRIQQLQVKANGSYMAEPVVDAPATPAQAAPATPAS